MCFIEKSLNMNLDEEIRCGYKVSAQMKHIWNVQMNLLKKLLEACEKHNLRIWASSGTLLGAVRHGGYIPWDDDIDMVMMRDDYNKLLSIASAEFKAPYFFQCAYTETVPYHRGHAQLRMDGTTAILPTDYKLDFHHGIFIDIFVFDAVPEDDKEVTRLIDNIHYWKGKVMQFVSSSRFSFNPIHDLKLLRRLIYCHTHDFIECYRKYEDALSTYSIADNTYVVKLGLRYDHEYVVKKKLNKNLYAKTIYMPFEDTQMPVPEEYDEVLTVLYGDYMNPNREPTYHGGYLAIDTEKTYEPYLQELRRTM